MQITFESLNKGLRGFSQGWKKYSDVHKVNIQIIVNKEETTGPEYRSLGTGVVLTRAVCREPCPAGSSLLRQQLEAGGGAEAEEEKEQSGAWQHDASQGGE